MLRQRILRVHVGASLQCSYVQALAQTVSSASQPAEGGQSVTGSVLQNAAPRIQELLARNRHGRPRAEYRLDVATLP